MFISVVDIWLRVFPELLVIAQLPLRFQLFTTSSSSFSLLILISLLTPHAVLARHRPPPKLPVRRCVTPVFCLEEEAVIL